MPPSLIAAAVLGLAMLVVGRQVRIAKLRRGLDQPLDDVPPELQQRWFQDPVIAGAGAITAVDAVWALSQVDPRVLDAIDFAHGSKAFQSYPELVHHVEDVVGRGDAALTGMVSQYKGYFGELAVADHLRAQGHLVEMSTSPNEAGVDAVVDGQPVQIKSGLESSAVTEHLEKYPDVPVITVAEHAEVFDGAEMVTVLPDVSGAALEASTRETLDGIGDLSEVGFDFPLITAAISGATNIAAVARGTRDLETALEFTGADTVGVGGGGFVGAKTGGLAGAAVAGPFGAAVGAVLGAVGGSVAGRKLAKLFKERGLRAARTELNTTLAELPEAFGEALARKEHALMLRAWEASPRGGLRWMWPTQPWLLRREIAARYRRWAKSCGRVRGELAEVAQQAMRGGLEQSSALGGALLQGGLGEPVFSGRLQALAARAKAAAERVQAELRRLGYTG